MRLKNDEKDFIVVASEEDDACYAYDLNNNFERTTVWNSIGGTMTMVQIPGTIDFLATQKFYPGFNSADCQIVKATFNGSGWTQTKLGDFPYIHRFDIVKVDSGFMYIGCSIANSKKDSEDWTDPGQVWVGEYNDDFTKINNLRKLDINITKNHGYKRMNGYSLVTGVQGIYKIIYPKNGSEWKIEKLTSRETSDIYIADINEDGFDEYMTIEGFHGPYVRISDHNFKTITLSGGDTPFGHAIWGGKLGSKEYFIFGWRDGSKNLELITSDELDTQIIDKNVGPSNITVYEKNEKKFLLSANRESNEVAVYEISI